jgi:hypothetical protein
MKNERGVCFLLILFIKYRNQTSLASVPSEQRTLLYRCI